MNKKSLFALSTEANDSSQIKETEVIIYAQISNYDKLEEANRIEKHEELNSTFSKGQRCRVRKVIEDGKEDKYYFTYKTKKTNIFGFEINDEYTIQADENFQEGFKNIAEKSINKTRYIFSSENVEMSFNIDGLDKTVIIPNIEYEVDVFNKPDGGISEWCKIDIEIDNIINYISKEFNFIEQLKLNIKIKHLPFKPINSILMFNATEEEKDLIGKLWNTEFATIL